MLRVCSCSHSDFQCDLGSCETLARVRGAREREAGAQPASMTLSLRTMTLRRSLPTVKQVIIERRIKCKNFNTASKGLIYNITKGYCKVTGDEVKGSSIDKSVLQGVSRYLPQHRACPLDLARPRPFLLVALVCLICRSDW